MKTIENLFNVSRLCPAKFTQRFLFNFNLIRKGKPIFSIFFLISLCFRNISRGLFQSHQSDLWHRVRLLRRKDLPHHVWRRTVSFCSISIFVRYFIFFNFFYPKVWISLARRRKVQKANILACTRLHLFADGFVRVYSFVFFEKKYCLWIFFSHHRMGWIAYQRWDTFPTNAL